MAYEITDPPGGTPREEHGRHHIYAAVMSVAPLCKHPDFAEEAEWRLYTGPVRIEQGTSLGFHPRRHTLSRFLEFSLSDRGAPLDDLQWIAGPGPQQGRANEALGWLALRERFTNYQGMPSQTPYLP